MLQAMRGKAASWIVKIILGILVIAFAAWGISDVFQNQPTSTVVAKVGDREIDVQQLQNQFRTEVQRLQPVFGNQLTEEQAVQIGLLDTALDRIITEAVLDGEANRRSVGISIDAIRQQIESDPLFSDGIGGFDEFRFRQVIAQAGLTEAGYIAFAQRALARALIIDTATAGVRPPTSLVGQFATRREERRSAEILVIPRDTLPEPAAPSDAEIAAYYETNTESFLSPEFRRLTYVSVNPADIVPQVRVDDAEIRSTYDANPSALVPPARRKVVNIVVGDRDAAASVSAAIKGGMSPEEAASQAGSQAAALGWQTRDQMLPALSEAAFSLGAGDVSDPVESPLGVHVLVIEEAEDFPIPSFEEARAAISARLAESIAVDRLVGIVNAMDDAIAGGATIEEAAEAESLSARTIEAIARTGAGPDGSPAVSPSLPPGFLETAFDTREGETSLMVETPNGGYFILRVDGITPPAARALDDVRQEVTAAVIQRRADEALTSRVTEIAEAVRNGAALASFEDAEARVTHYTPNPVRRIDTDESTGLTSTIVSELFASAPGDVVVDPDGATGIVAKLVAIIEPTEDQAGAAKTAIEVEMRRELSQDVADQLEAALRRRTDIDINQAMIDRFFRSESNFGAQ